ISYSVPETFSVSRALKLSVLTLWPPVSSLALVALPLGHPVGRLAGRPARDRAHGDAGAGEPKVGERAGLDRRDGDLHLVALDGLDDAGGHLLRRGRPHAGWGL